eukprot:s2041_g2.t1
MYEPPGRLKLVRQLPPWLWRDERKCGAYKSAFVRTPAGLNEPRPMKGEQGVDSLLSGLNLWRGWHSATLSLGMVLRTSWNVAGLFDDAGTSMQETLLTRSHSSAA